MNLASSRRRLLAFALLASTLAAGCSHVVVHAKAGALTGTVSARLVLVAPVELHWDEPSALLAYARTLDVEEALCRDGALATFGPGELAPTSGISGTLAESDVSRASLRSGVPVGQILFVRTTAERREQRSSVRLNDAGGRAAGGARDALVTLVARAEITLPATHQLLAESSVEEPLDPGAETPLFDGQPELGPLLQRAVEEAMRTLRGKLLLPEPLQLGLRALPSVSPALNYALPQRLSFIEATGAQDSLEQEVSRQAALELLAQRSGASDELRRGFRLERQGLLVTQARGRAKDAGLARGDHILAIDGLPQAHPCALQRALRLATKTVHVQLERAGRPLTVELEPPAAK